MANIKTAKKNIRIIDRRTAINRSRKSKIRTSYSKVLLAISTKNEAQARTNFVLYESAIMKGVSQGIYKKNTVSRKLRNLAHKIRNINVKA